MTGDAGALGPLADLVLGQPDFETGSVDPDVGREALNAPQGVCAFGNRLWVVDADHQRVLQWDDEPPTSHVRYRSDERHEYRAESVQLVSGARRRLRRQGLSCDGSRLIVADTHNHRVLVWNTIPSSDGAAADLVLGQSDFKSNDSGNGQGQMQYPRGVWTDGTRLVVADTGNNRVLIWNTFPTTNGALPDLVLGQAGFGTSDAPDPPTASSMWQPRGVVAFDAGAGTILWVADTNNNRVLVWHTFPTTNGQAPDIALGQPALNTNVVAPINAASLNRPFAVAVNSAFAPFGETSLVVADYLNHRVVEYPSGVLATGTPAVVVYGQPDLDTLVENSPPTQDTIAFPNGVAVVGGKLYVSHSEPHSLNHNRVLRFPLVAPPP